MDADQLRRLALSRARQVANQARQNAQTPASLCGLAVGDVLDYIELGLFVAVTSITPGCVHVLGVRQFAPGTALKELHMPADLVRFRLQRRWLRLVPDRRR